MNRERFNVYLPLIAAEAYDWLNDISRQNSPIQDYTNFRGFGFRFILEDEDDSIYTYRFKPLWSYKDEQFSGYLEVNMNEKQAELKKTWNDNNFGGTRNGGND